MTSPSHSDKPTGDEQPTTGAEAEAIPEIVDQTENADAAVAPEQEAADESPCAALEQELAERTDDLQRVTAEYANFRRRTERDRGMHVASAKAKLVLNFLPIIDDLDLAESHGDIQGAMKAFNDKFRAALTACGVEQFAVPGDPFDPERHEAVQDLSSGEDKVLGQVLRSGFMMDGRLVRTAMVIISDPDDTNSEDTQE